jgi:hypothetical protein
VYGLAARDPKRYCKAIKTRMSKLPLDMESVNAMAWCWCSPSPFRGPWCTEEARVAPNIAAPAAAASSWSCRWPTRSAVFRVAAGLLGQQYFLQLQQLPICISQYRAGVGLGPRRIPGLPPFPFAHTAYAYAMAWCWCFPSPFRGPWCTEEARVAPNIVAPAASSWSCRWPTRSAVFRVAVGLLHCK